MCANNDVVAFVFGCSNVGRFFRRRMYSTVQFLFFVSLSVVRIHCTLYPHAPYISRN